MRTLMRIFITGITFVLMIVNADAQQLSLAEIIEVGKMDSTQLKNFSDSKGFQLKKLDVDSWKSFHEYQSNLDTTIRITKTFTKGKTLLSDANPGMVHYYFSDKALIKDFKKEMKGTNFKYHKSDTTNHRGNFFIHNKYRTANEEIDLVSQQLPGHTATYALIYYRRPN